MADYSQQELDAVNHALMTLKEHANKTDTSYMIRPKQKLCDGCRARVDKSVAWCPECESRGTGAAILRRQGIAIIGERERWHSACTEVVRVCRMMGRDDMAELIEGLVREVSTSG